MISTALAGDAVVGNVQEKAMREHDAGNAEVIFYSYSAGFAVLLLGLALTGGLATGAAHFSQSPGGALYVAAALYSVTGYLGMQVS